MNDINSSSKRSKVALPESTNRNARAHTCAYLYVSAVVSSGRQLYAPKSDGTLERHPDGRLLHAVLSVEPGGPGNGTAAEVPFDCTHARTHTRQRRQKWPTVAKRGRPSPRLTLGDAVLGGESLLHQALKNRTHRRTVDQLQHEQVGLRDTTRDKTVRRTRDARRTERRAGDGALD